MWEKYVIELSPFYFTLLSHYMQSIVANQLDFVKEDATLMLVISNLFRVRSLEVIPRQSILRSNKAAVETRKFTIDGLVSLDRLEDLLRNAFTQLIGLSKGKLFKYGLALSDDETFWNNIYLAAEKVERYDFERAFGCDRIQREVTVALEDYL